MEQLWRTDFSIRKQSSLLDNFLLRWLFSQHKFDYPSTIDCREKSKVTKNILHSHGSHEQLARRRIPRRVKAMKGRVQNQVESALGCHVLDPQIILKDAWKGQREDSHQRGTSTVRPVADEEKTELKVDFRIQGIPQAPVVQEDERNGEIKGRFIWSKIWMTRVQKIGSCNLFSEESKKIIHNLGNVEYFELCEMSSETQCLCCW